MKSLPDMKSDTFIFVQERNHFYEEDFIAIHGNNGRFRLSGGYRITARLQLQRLLGLRLEWGATMEIGQKTTGVSLKIHPRAAFNQETVTSPSTRTPALLGMIFPWKAENRRSPATRQLLPLQPEAI